MADQADGIIHRWLTQEDLNKLLSLAREQGFAAGAAEMREQIAQTFDGTALAEMATKIRVMVVTRPDV